MIAIFCGKVLQNGKATIFGDGKQTRDYIYVDDVVEANLKAAEADATGRSTSGVGQKSVLDLRREPQAARVRRLRPRPRTQRPGEIKNSALDPSRAREELGWEARVQLDEGLKRTLDSLRS